MEPSGLFAFIFLRRRGFCVSIICGYVGVLPFYFGSTSFGSLETWPILKHEDIEVGGSSQLCSLQVEVQAKEVVAFFHLANPYHAKRYFEVGNSRREGEFF